MPARDKRLNTTHSLKNLEQFSSNYYTEGSKAKLGMS